MASKSMTKSAIIAHLATKLDCTKKFAGQFWDELLSLAHKEAKKNSFIFPGLGKLLVVERKKRIGRNPSTGESIVIPKKKVLKFRIAKQVKDAILPPKA